MMFDLPELVILDIGHGNCALLIDGDDVSVFDCASKSAFPIIDEALQRYTINSINNIFISHADADHIGGLIGLLRKYSVNKVFVNADSKDSKTWIDARKALYLALKSGNTSCLHAYAPQTINTENVKIEILAPNVISGLAGASGLNQAGEKLNSNAASTVIRLDYLGYKILLPGDLDDIGLRDILEAETDISANLVVFPHHGGATGSSDNGAFATRLSSVVKPDSIIFSLGRAKSKNYHYPRDDIMQGLLSVTDNPHIICTQLSIRCSQNTPISDFSHLSNLPAAGRRSEACCGGSVLIQMNGDKSSFTPTRNPHQTFISDQVEGFPVCFRPPQLITRKSFAKSTTQ